MYLYVRTQSHLGNFYKLTQVPRPSNHEEKAENSL